MTLVVALIASPMAAIAKQPANSGSTAIGQVFFPNPVAQLQDQSLTDMKDADYAALQPAYKSVTLTNLDGSGYLHGAWASVVSETGAPAFSTNGHYVYTRHDDRFEQVMAYYWVTRAQLYLQSLGFNGVKYRGINMDPQHVRINQLGYDNSFATDHPKDEMRFGKGGVDDAEDAEVILHEYGHQIHFSQSATFFGSEEAGAISEGFGDYWAADVTNLFAPTLDPECVADWDSVSYTRLTTAHPVHCLRRLDAPKLYPDDLVGEVHRDGEIWSHALWDIRTAVGATKADTSMLRAQFDWSGTTMPALAQRIVAAARATYDNATANAVQAAFEGRGIL